MKTKDIVNISLFATLLAVCAWISIPTAVPFTMQTFAVFLAMLVLGGKKGTIVILIYMLLGIMGIPVFSKGTAGVGVLLGPTGGYMIGWLILGILQIAADKLVAYMYREHLGKSLERQHSKKIKIAALVIGLIMCYGFGTLWFTVIYAKTTEINFTTAFATCVIPFVIPDLLKLWLACVVSRRVKKVITDV